MRLCNHTNAKHRFGLCLQVFRQDGPSQRIDRFDPMRNWCKVSLPRTQRRILSLEIKPGRATFRSLARSSATELSPPPYQCTVHYKTSVGLIGTIKGFYPFKLLRKRMVGRNVFFRSLKCH